MEDITNSEIIHVIDEYIHNEKYRAVLKSRFVDGLSYERLSEKHDISVRQAKRIVYKYELKIFEHLF